VIRHYSAPADDLVNGWSLVNTPDFIKPDPIDATLFKVGDTFHNYYRVGGKGGIQWATSKDLENWTNKGKCPGDLNAPQRGYQEGAYVFRFEDAYWMLTDPHKGLHVYRSSDAIKWNLTGNILKNPGAGPQDGTRARHPSVAVIGNRAFLFYHVEPNRPYPTPKAQDRTPKQKISFLQVAELKLVDGTLTCDRDRPVIPNLPR
jgi:hypothetical protein